jgi:hypothetical protein
MLQGSGRRASQLAVCGCLIGAVAACSLPLPGGPSPAQMLSRALTTLRDTPSVKISGSVRQLDVSYGVLLSQNHSGDASGAVNDGQYIVSVRRVNGKIYLSSSDFFQQVQQLRVGSRYVTGGSDAVSQLVAALTDRSALVSALGKLTGGTVTAAPGPQMDGASTTWLVADGISVMVGERDPTRPLRLITLPGRTVADKLSSLVLQVETTGVTLSRDLFPGVVDLADPNTLPMLIVTVPGSFRYELCDSGGCTTTTDVRNDGGKIGTASATFTVSQAGKQLGLCLATVPALANKETAKVGCRLNYPRTNLTDTTSILVGNVTISNSLP